MYIFQNNYGLSDFLHTLMFIHNQNGRHVIFYLGLYFYKSICKNEYNRHLETKQNRKSH